MAIRVVLAEGDHVLREGAGRLLGSEGVEVVATCGDYESLVRAVESTVPDVVVTGVGMPPSGTDEGIRAAREWRGRYPDLGVVVVSEHAEPAYALELLANGSKGRAYVSKEKASDAGQLADAIRVVSRGGSVIDPAVIDALVATRSRAPESALGLLTARETEILGEMAEGKNNAAVAASLVLSERAVEKHINSIFSKLAVSRAPDVHARVKAVLLFLSARSG